MADPRRWQQSEQLFDGLYEYMLAIGHAMASDPVDAPGRASTWASGVRVKPPDGRGPYWTTGLQLAPLGPSEARAPALAETIETRRRGRYTRPRFGAIGNGGPRLRVYTVAPALRDHARRHPCTGCGRRIMTSASRVCQQCALSAVITAARRETDSIRGQLRSDDRLSRGSSPWHSTRARPTPKPGSLPARPAPARSCPHRDHGRQPGAGGHAWRMLRTCG